MDSELIDDGEAIIGCYATAGTRECRSVEAAVSAAFWRSAPIKSWAGANGNTGRHLYPFPRQNVLKRLSLKENRWRR